MPRLKRWYSVVALCVLPLAASAPQSQQLEQQRLAQSEARRSLEESERRIAASQAEQIRQAQERSEQQRRDLAEADRRRQAEQRHEEFLQAQARAQQSNQPQPDNTQKPPQIAKEASPLPAVAVVPPSPVEPRAPRYVFARPVGLALMIGAACGALFILCRMAREWLAH